MAHVVYHSRKRMSVRTPWIHGTRDGVDLMGFAAYIRGKYSDCTFEDVDRGNELEKILKITGPRASLVNYLDEVQDIVPSPMGTARKSYESDNFIVSEYSDIEEAEA